MGHQGISWLGAFVLWIANGFKEKGNRYYYYHKFAFVVGIITIAFFVFILYLIYNYNKI